jgi:hypothetical protein
MLHRFPALRGLFLVALFLASLFLGAAVVRRFLPFPQIEGIEGKVTWLAQHGAEYDTLFTGSSRVLWHIIPSEFDAAMAGAGQATRSFNLGYTSLRPPEDSYVLEKVLATRQARLRFVIVEADEIELEVRDEIAGTARQDYWHDLRRMRALTSHALDAIGKEAGWWASFDERRDAYRELLWHIPPFLAWAVNLGQGEALLPSHGKERDWDALVGARRDGFTEEKDEPLSASDAKSLGKQMKKKRSGPKVAGEAGQELFADMERQITRAGARMIVIIPPRTQIGAILPDPKRFPHVPVLDFSDAKRYPELFEGRHRYDFDHLNFLGAAVFSRLLAARILELDQR